MTRKIILIGAARSGTKILRDVLATATGAGCVPYDISFVWRYRNESVPHDVLDPRSATPSIRNFVRNYIDRYASDNDVVIEKTVGNALRVPYVREVLPEAGYIHLVRNGIDVAESTRRQWVAPPDGKYLARKIRHFPLRLVPTYGRKYAVSMAHQFLTKDGRVATWGPRYPGIDGDVSSSDLLTVCARQWQTCIEAAEAAFAELDAPVSTVHYEDLVTDPVRVLEAVLSVHELQYDPESLKRAASMLEHDHVGYGGQNLAPGELRTVRSQLSPTLTRLGYLEASSGGEDNDKRHES